MFQKSKWLILVLCLATTLCACANTNHSAESENPGSTSSAVQDETQYDYQLKAGEPIEVYDVVFDQMVTVTVDPHSTRDAAKNLRSDILFDNCTFHGGLTIVGDYHAMINRPAHQPWRAECARRFQTGRDRPRHRTRG